MEAAVAKIFEFAPLLWGLGFLAPLTAQILDMMHWAAPWGLTPLGFGFIIGGIWGIYAQVRGTWLW
ncbi:hypothetical protein SAMN02745824_3328 [Parasphingorhabdus marina DSM 22363]|uniref:Uncharacterized protein n=1 Tax=Parasphingorhabdus marina DSM 22363 TaxID=1123272 RepID=A0A1N6HK84_9SPHN|nr:hypothetical protein [Parasphingorhabdus marina]SIO20147.1 hypothetical protein SAMN02745824_3328 [Parasphingorhabdus marina DSM 22363]